MSDPFRGWTSNTAEEFAGAWGCASDAAMRNLDQFGNDPDDEDALEVAETMREAFEALADYLEKQEARDLKEKVKS